MTVTLYNNKSSGNTINKTLDTVQTDITATAKGVIDVDKPSLLLDYSSMNFNYFYISDFGRYYNVTSRQLLPGSHILLTGESDPLQSFAAGIETLDVLVIRAEDLALREPEVADERIPMANDVIYDMIAGDTIMAGENYILGVC